MSSNVSLKSTTEAKSTGTLKCAKSTSMLPAIIQGKPHGIFCNLRWLPRVSTKVTI